MSAPPPAFGPIGTYGVAEPLLDATRADGQARLYLHRPDGVSVVLGRSSRPERELHTDRCATDGVAVLRRRGGGCAVVLDPGNVVVDVALRLPGLRIEDHFRRLSAWLMDGLQRAGVPDVRREDVSDLCVGDRKIAGACMYRARDVLLYGVSLLVSPDLALLDRYLQHPPREPAYRRGRPHGEFVTTVQAHTGLDAATLLWRLQKSLEPPRLD